MEQRIVLEYKKNNILNTSFRSARAEGDDTLKPHLDISIWNTNDYLKNRRANLVIY